MTIVKEIEKKTFFFCHFTRSHGRVSADWGKALKSVTGVAWKLSSGIQRHILPWKRKVKVIGSVRIQKSRFKFDWLHSICLKNPKSKYISINCGIFVGYISEYLKEISEKCAEKRIIGTGQRLFCSSARCNFWMTFWQKQTAWVTSCGNTHSKGHSTPSSSL